MSKHTPGEWTAVIDDYGFRIEALTFLSTGEVSTRTEVARRDADIKCPPRDCYGEAFKVPCADANAFLIAAAPDLLGALKMVLDDPEALQGRPRTYERVMKAIKKAEGGE